MISTTTLDAITPVVMRLKELRRGLTVDPSSPIAFLNESSKTPLIGLNSITDEEFFSQYPESLKRDLITGDSVVQELSYDDGHSYKAFPVAIHETTMLEMAKMIRTRTAALMDHSRNVVFPFVNEVFRRYNEPEETAVTEKWSLVPVDLNAGYMSDIVDRLMSKVSAPLKMAWDYTSPYPVRLPTELELPKTGSKKYDDLMSGLLKDLDMSALEVLASIFDKDTPNPNDAKAWVSSTLKLAQWLLLEYYSENPWTDSGLSDTQWSSVISTGYRHALIGWCANMLNNFACRYELNDTVLSFDAQQNEVYVLWPVYEKYLSEGGAPEVIYGAIYHSEMGEGYVGFTINSLKEHQDKCIAAWSKYTTVSEARINEEWLNDTVRGLQRAMLDTLSELDDELLPENVSRADITKCIHAEILKCVNKISMEDPTYLIIGLVGDCVFPHTDCGYVLKGIHSKVKEGVPAGEAAAQVELAYIKGYVLSGISM